LRKKQGPFCKKIIFGGLHIFCGVNC
jgi:hypothetical protein